MTTQYEYLCEQQPGYDTGLTDHMNRMGAQAWELVAAQFETARPPHVWLIWRRQTTS
jgi:hypothetical protein